MSRVSKATSVCLPQFAQHSVAGLDVYQHISTIGLVLLVQGAIGVASKVLDLTVLWSRDL